MIASPPPQETALTRTSISVTDTKILIVDDKESNVEMLMAVLGDEGYRVHGLSNSLEVSDIVRELSPDLILLDIMMPEKDGLTVCSELKRSPEHQDIPVIFLTARDQTEDVVRGFEHGASDYLTKPVNTAELLARVKTHITLRLQSRELKALAEKDGLTGVANRRKFDSFLQYEFDRCRMEQIPLSLLMIDIDFFKDYNDNYGHLAGDDALKKVANTIGACVYINRGLIARYGGEEFAVVLPDTDLASAKGIAENMRRSVEELGIIHGTGHASDIISVSIGAADSVTIGSSNMADLIAAADRQLYLAKEAGRNIIR